MHYSFIGKSRAGMTHRVARSRYGMYAVSECSLKRSGAFSMGKGTVKVTEIRFETAKNLEAATRLCPICFPLAKRHTFHGNHRIVNEQAKTIVYFPNSEEECDTWFEANDPTYKDHAHTSQGWPELQAQGYVMASLHSQL